MSITIPVTGGYSTVLDDCDSDLASITWGARHGHNVYAKHDTKKGGVRKSVYLHRVILERKIGRKLEPGEYTDHINGDKLDNHRANLRVVTASQNQHNRGKSRRNKSGYKGVHYNQERKKWVASIHAGGKITQLGRFTSAIQAALAYDEAARKYHGDFAVTNF